MQARRHGRLSHEGRQTCAARVALTRPSIIIEVIQNGDIPLVALGLGHERLQPLDIDQAQVFSLTTQETHAGQATDFTGYGLAVGAAASRHVGQQGAGDSRASPPLPAVVRARRSNSAWMRFCTASVLNSRTRSDSRRTSAARWRSRTSASRGSSMIRFSS